MAVKHYPLPPPRPPRGYLPWPIWLAVMFGLSMVFMLWLMGAMCWYTALAVWYLFVGVAWIYILAWRGLRAAFFAVLAAIADRRPDPEPIDPAR